MLMGLNLLGFFIRERKMVSLFLKTRRGNSGNSFGRMMSISGKTKFEITV